MKKFIPSSLALLIAALTFAGKPAIDDHEIHEGIKFVSPDRRYTAEILSGNDTKLKIMDHQMGTDSSVALWTVPTSIRWTGNSKTMVVVAHIAGGSQADLIHLKGAKWIDIQAPPPVHHTPVKYSVVKEEVGTSRVTLTYEVTNQAQNGAYQDFYRYSFTTDPATGVVSNIRRSRSENY